jgi:hypothetical protein
MTEHCGFCKRSLHQDLLTLRPKSPSSSNSFGSSLPTEILPRKSPFGNREIGSRDIARFVALLPVTQPPKPRMPMVNGQCSGYRAFPYRDIATGDANLLAFQTPNAEVPSSPTRSHLDSTRSRAPRCHVTSGFRESRVLDAKFPAAGNHECRNSDALDPCHLSLQQSTAPIKSGDRTSRFRRACVSYTRQPRLADMRWQMILSAPEG